MTMVDQYTADPGPRLTQRSGILPPFSAPIFSGQTKVALPELSNPGRI